MRLGTICYIDNGSSYLLLHRNKKDNDLHQGKWIGVGGKLEKGESPEECVKREVFEETGLTIHEPILKGMITFPNFDGVNDWYVFVYTATHYTGQIGECLEGTLEWVPYAEVLRKPTWEGDALFLQWLLNKQPFFSAKLTYDNQKLLAHDVVFYDK